MYKEKIRLEPRFKVKGAKSSVLRALGTSGGAQRLNHLGSHARGRSPDPKMTAAEAELGREFPPPLPERSGVGGVSSPWNAGVGSLFI